MNKERTTNGGSAPYLGESGARSAEALDSALIQRISDYVAGHLAGGAFKHAQAPYTPAAEIQNAPVRYELPRKKRTAFRQFRMPRWRRSGPGPLPPPASKLDFGPRRKAEAASASDELWDEEELPAEEASLSAEGTGIEYEVPVPAEEQAEEEELPEEEGIDTAIFSPIIDEPEENEPFPTFSQRWDNTAMYSLDEQEEEDHHRPQPMVSMPASARREDDRVSMLSREDMLSAPEERIAERIRRLDKSFGETLLDLIEEKRMKNSEFYNRANISKQLFHRITTQTDRPPKKNIALACAVALRLDLEETKSLLEKAGYALSPADVTDVIVEAFISAKHYDIFDINEYLYKYERGLLGSSMN